MHAHRTPKARRRAMRRFRQGKTRVLLATEVAGMVRPIFFCQCLSVNSMIGC
jgi:hypothetical protein